MLPPDLLERVLIQAEKLDSIVVGGQALNFWAEHYIDRGVAELEQNGPFQSKDIDFLGTADDARQLAAYFDSELQIPSKDDTVTPNSALVVIEAAGQKYVIDFLHSVLGPRTQQVKDRAQLLLADLGSPDGETEVHLMHPADILTSRILGITQLGRSDDTAIRQMKAAPIILREFIRDLLDSRDPDFLKQAQEFVQDMIWAGSEPLHDQILAEHGIDILPYALDLAGHPAWDPRFSEHQITNACRAKAEKRDRRIAESDRRRAGGAGGIL